MNVTVKYCTDQKILHYNEKQLPLDLNTAFSMASIGTVIKVIDKVENVLTLEINMPVNELLVPA